MTPKTPSPRFPKAHGSTAVDTGRSSARRPTFLIAATLLSLFLATAVVGYFNAAAVLAAMKPIGVGGFLAVVVAQIALYAPLGLAWWLASGEGVRRIALFSWGSAVAEATANILPLSQIGGALFASRAVALGGVARPRAMGSNIADITMEIAAQLLYTLVGLAILVSHLGLTARRNPLLAPLVLGFILAAGLVAAFIVIQRRGLPSLEALARRLNLPATRRTQSVRRVIEAIYHQPLRLLACFGVHLFAWFAAAGGAWLILDLIGRPLPLTSVLAIESLLLAIRNAAFFAPAGLGVQEGAYAVLGPLFGLPPEAAIALSLLKRGRDIAIGVPVLISWQVMETRHSLRRRVRSSSGT